MENKYECKICNLVYKTRNGLFKHNKKYHPNDNNKNIPKKYCCDYCNKGYNTRQSKWMHMQKCKVTNTKKLQKEDKITEQFTDLTNKIKKLEETVSQQPQTQVIKNKVTLPDNSVQINKQLIETFTNKLSDKDLTIAKLLEQNNNSNSNIHINNNILTWDLSGPYKININNTIFIASSKNNYFNGTLICKHFSHDINKWLNLPETKVIIYELTNSNSNINDPICFYYEENELIWLHPNLTLILARWISPEFLVQSCLLLTNLLEINNNLVKNYQLANGKINTLTNSLAKKQPRTNYPEKNVVYLITTDAHAKNRTYIVGKAGNLTVRLSTYNKTCEHNVIYYRSCLTEENMSVVEQMVLNKLDPYRAVANRDRFVLPVDKPIEFFTNVFDSAVDFLAVGADEIEV